MIKGGKGDIINWDSPVRRGSSYLVCRPPRVIVINIVADCIFMLKTILSGVSTYYCWSNDCFAVNLKILGTPGNRVYVCELVNVENLGYTALLQVRGTGLCRGGCQCCFDVYHRVHVHIPDTSFDNSQEEVPRSCVC